MASHGGVRVRKHHEPHPHIFCCVRFHLDAVTVVGMVVAAGGGLRVD